MPARIIAVTNQKGGVGKTTTAISIAAQLSSSENPVLLIDLDPQGNATSGLGIAKDTLGSTTYDVISGNFNIDHVVHESQTMGLSVLPSNSNLAGAEVELVNTDRREYKLKEALTQQDYSFIIIDCPPSLGLLTVNALTAATDVIIPVQAEYYALEGLGQLLTTIQRVRETLNPQLELLGVVVTMYNKRTSLSNQVVAEIKNYFGDKLFKTIIPRNVRLAEAPSFGQTIYQHDHWSKGARAYKQLTKEVKSRVS